MPCWELFDGQPEDYRRATLGRSRVRIGIEAASSFGWERYLGSEGAFIGMHSFGASGPYMDVYKRFGITPEAAAEKALAALNAR
jgi:transketolase